MIQPSAPHLWLYFSWSEFEQYSKWRRSTAPRKPAFALMDCGAFVLDLEDGQSVELVRSKLPWYIQDAI